MDSISPYFERLEQRWFPVTPKSSHTLQGNPDNFFFNARGLFPADLSDEALAQSDLADFR